jgi:hypothetical protein
MSPQPLTILTVCSRPQNLPKLAVSLAPGKEHFDLRWRILFDPALASFPDIAICLAFNAVMARGIGVQTSTLTPGPTPHPRGVNTFLDELREGWTWFLDDDNLVHPDFFAGLADLLQQQPEKRAWVFSQALCGPPPWVRQAHPGMVRENHIDGAQYAFHRELIAGDRFPLRYSCDGAFVEAIYQRAPQAFGFTSQVLCYYNRLRPPA